MNNLGMHANQDSHGRKLLDDLLVAIVGSSPRPACHTIPGDKDHTQHLSKVPRDTASPKG
jgi:hypothetical protein